MTTRWLYFFGQGQADGGEALRHLVGGKGASLAEMTRAGLNVPPGFTISTECCDFFHKNDQRLPDGLLEAVRAGIERLELATGRTFGATTEPLLVAVRSGAAQSMPGMMDSLLNVGSWEALQDAIVAVLRSWNSDRALAYRLHNRIDALPGTAVNVQVMCPSEVAGVLFTANPVDPGTGQMIIESSYGLGEAVVLGKVVPDRFILASEPLVILERHLADEGRGASLHDEQVLELARLGRRVEDYFHYPCDIEWGLADGQFYLLQARAIKLAGQSAAVDRDEVRREEMDILRALARPEGTVWSRYNLAEILPEPTPLTSALVRRFMSGRGGFGLMYRDLGFEPDPALDEIGIFDLICGRPYCNLSREPKMQYRHLPFEHRFAMLKASPARALYPQAILNPARAGWRFWFFLPFIFFKVWRASARVRGLMRTFAGDFEQRLAPAFLREVEVAAAEDLATLDNQQLLARLDYWIEKALVDFARASLKPTALAGIAMGNIERALAQRYQPPGTPGAQNGEPTALGKAQAVLRELVMGVKPPPLADLPGAIRNLAAGRSVGAISYANSAIAAVRRWSWRSRAGRRTRPPSMPCALCRSTPHRRPRRRPTTRRPGHVSLTSCAYCPTSRPSWSRSCEPCIPTWPCASWENIVSCTVTDCYVVILLSWTGAGGWTAASFSCCPKNFRAWGVAIRTMAACAASWRPSSGSVGAGANWP